MTPIANALALGYGAEHVLNFVSKAFPSLNPKIKRAKEAGHPIDKILSIIDKGMGGNQDLSELSQQQIHKVQNDQQNQTAKNLLKTGIGAAGIYGGLKAIPGIAQGLGKALGIGPKPMSNAPGVSLPPISSSENPTNSQSPLQSNTDQSPPLAGQVQPQTQSQQTSQSPLQQNLSQPQSPSGASPKERANAIIQKLGIEDSIIKSNKRGKSLESVTKDVINNLSPQQKQEYQQLSRSAQIPPMAQLVKDYLVSDAMHQPSQESQPNTNLLPKSNELVGEENQPPEPPRKGSIASTPDGKVGEIKELRNGQALIESDGKLHKVKESDLQGSPIPEKDLGELYDDLLQGIEKETGEDVSRNVNWAGYDPEKKELFYLPHLGAGYTYSDISPEDAKLLTGILNTRKTSGENFIGAWKQGSKSPIGAAMSALVRKLQSERGGKGKEYDKKYQTIYSAHEPAQQAAKKKKKMRKT